MDRFEELTKYKQLLDQGIITKEEFEDAKSKLLKKNAFHEHLSTGARVASSSFGSLKKKTEDVYAAIKEKGNTWIEKELEKEQIIEEQKKNLRAEKTKEEYKTCTNRSKEKGLKATAIKRGAKIIASVIIILILLLTAALTGTFLLREKIDFTADSTEAIHGLEYSVSSKYKIKKTPNKKSDDNMISPEREEYEIYNRSNTLIGTYSIEYLGEDVDLNKHKEKVCRSLFKRKTSQSDDTIIIDGYCKKNKLSFQNITGNGLVKQRVLLVTKDYSCFKVDFRCNAWNYSKEECDQLFDAVKIRQYKNKNIAETLNITYNGTDKSGYKPAREDFKVEVEYKNGKKSLAEVYQLHAPEELNEKDNQVMIECHGIKKQLYLTPHNDEETETDNKPKSDSIEDGGSVPFGEDGQQA